MHQQHFTLRSIRRCMSIDWVRLTCMSAACLFIHQLTLELCADFLVSAAEAIQTDKPPFFVSSSGALPPAQINGQRRRHGAAITVL